MILEEFDECPNATFDPCEVVNAIDGFPKVGITCFSKKLLDQLIEKFDVTQIAITKNANGETPIYKIDYNDREYVLFLSDVGAPACIAEYEDLFEFGLEKLVVFGTCGALDREIEDLAIIIPDSAVRDEGTSYHYAKASREIETNPKYKEEFIELLKEHNYSYAVGKVWTTDGIYRETRKKVIDRKNEGCICVDMECSAIAALAKFRNKEVFQFFYATDNLDAAVWDQRSLGNSDKLSEKEKIGLLAIKMAEKIYKK